jgi:S-formylglutathione hydrolase FrmB
MILIMPDGDDSWYTTWNFLGDYQGCLTAPVPARPDEEAADYCVPWPHYDDYIARDLVAHVDSSFRTLADRRHRGIAGLSMGGYGAVMLALAYPDVFAAAASHSGVLAPLLVASDSTGGARYARETEAVRSRYPGLWPSQSLAFGRDTAGWWARDPGRRVERLARAGNPAPLSLSPSLALPHLYIDAGSEDPYLSQSRVFRDVLRRLRISHEYRERPGTHDWRYWRENAAHSLTFLARAFAP